MVMKGKDYLSFLNVAGAVSLEKIEQVMSNVNMYDVK